MIVPKERVSFARILNLLKSIDATSGAFLLRDPTKKKSIKDHIFKQTMHRQLFLYIFFMISTLIVTDYELISIIFCASVTPSVFGCYAVMINYISNKDIVKDLINWCESIYDVEKKYHKIMYTTAETKLVQIESQSRKVVIWLRRIYYSNLIGFTLGFAIVGLLLPEHIYPKFSPTLPFYLPFKDQKTWFAFVCTTFFETLLVVDTATIAIFSVGFGVTIFIHTLGYLDIIQQAVEKMKNDFLISTRNDEVTSKSLKKPILSLNTLAAVNADLMQSQNDSLSFDEWIKVLNDMICDVNSVIVKAGKLYASTFLIFEFAGFGAFFVCGLLITVVHENYLFAIGINIVCSLLFIICFINEKIIEKFENINETIYDVPWYNLTSNQQKSLMTLMHCDKIQKGLTASGIHTLTLERFGIIVKAGYTNLLVLQDLVQK